MKYFNKNDEPISLLIFSMLMVVCGIFFIAFLSEDMFISTIWLFGLIASVIIFMTIKFKYTTEILYGNVIELSKKIHKLEDELYELKK